MRYMPVVTLVWAAFAAAGDDGGTAIARMESGEYALRRGGREYARCALPAVKGVEPPAVAVAAAGDGWTRLRLTWTLPKAVAHSGGRRTWPRTRAT